MVFEVEEAGGLEGVDDGDGDRMTIGGGATEKGREVDDLVRLDQSKQSWVASSIIRRRIPTGMTRSSFSTAVTAG